MEVMASDQLPVRVWLAGTKSEPRSGTAGYAVKVSGVVKVVKDHFLW